MNYFGGWGTPGFIAGFGGFVFLFILWCLIWKGLALWHAGRRGEKGWFVALLVLNTGGILEIVYLLAIVKINQNFKSTEKNLPATPSSKVE